MNPQSVYHAYAMTYLELQRARHEDKPVPASVLARFTSADPDAIRAVMRALKDVELIHPLRPKEELVGLLRRTASARVA